MHFEPDDDQVALKEGIRSFCAGVFPLESVGASEESGGAIDRTRWTALAELGVFSLRRDGFGVADSVLALEELGRALVPGPLVETMLAATHLGGALGDGAAAGSTIVGVTWPADPTIAVEHPADLDALLVLTPAGIRAVDRASLVLETAERPLDALTPVSFLRGELPVGELVGDAALATRWADEGAVLTAALQLGVSLGALDLAVEYAKHRQQFGRAIGSFQAIKHLAADVLTKCEVARAAVYAAACALDERSTAEPRMAVSTAKLLAGDTAIFATRAGIQIHGGMGFTWEVNAQRYWKRACVLDTHYGNSDRHAELVADLIDERDAWSGR